MRALTIFTTARTLRDYSPECDITLDELIESDPDFTGTKENYFKKKLQDAITPAIDAQYGLFGISAIQRDYFMVFVNDFVAPAAYLEYRRRKTFTSDCNEFYDHMNAWGISNSLYYTTKFLAIKEQVSKIDGVAIDTETHSEEVKNNGSNESTSTISSTSESKEKSSDFAVWDTSAQVFDDKMQSNGRNLNQTGSSTGKNNATASATETRESSTQRGTSGGRTPIEIQEEYVKRIQNLTKQIVDDFGQFFNGNLYSF